MLPGDLGAATGGSPQVSASDSQAYASSREGAAAEKLAMEPRPPPGPHDMPLRQYMDTYVVPCLLPGLNVVAEERPENPVEFLAYYLLKNNPKNKKQQDATSNEQEAAAETES